VTQSDGSIAVVGAGFSGLMTALNLLRGDPGVRVILIDQHAPFGQGLAFGAANPDHVLNVRAANMSAWPDAPRHFTDWLARRPGGVGGAGFATRGEYGTYLQHLLTQVAEGPQAAGRLNLVPDEVVHAAPFGQGWRIDFAMGHHAVVDALILATGNARPLPPPGLTAEAAQSPLYQPDPWRWTLPGLEGNDPVLLIGSGLTMVDVALAVQRHAPGRPMVALSRRGLRPLAHAETGQPCALPPPAPGASPREILRWLREASAAGEWRAAIDALRPTTQHLWRAWSPDQKRAFLRHARPYWEVHRHRLAPTIAERIAGLCDTGLLRIVAGRLTKLDLIQGGLAAQWTPRGTRQTITQRVAGAFNCTGPASDALRAPGPLLSALATQGKVCADPLGLGLWSGLDGRLVDSAGQPQARLFAVGPITRGAMWENTAVPDIRVQAAEVARSVLAALRPEALRPGIELEARP
jgi:uncharacterized NAD(P)/FAD-binding protein YdhS